MDNDIVVVDDLLPRSLTDTIKHYFYGDNGMWNYINDVTDGNKDNKRGRPALHHKFVDYGKQVSDRYSMLWFIPHIATSYYGYNLQKVSLARAFMQFPLSEEVYGGNNNKLQDSYHVDQVDPHLVVLYYVNDSDGDTIILENRYEQKNNNSSFPDGGIPDHEQKICQRVSPKQGRIVMFNGFRYHTAEQPRKNMRSVINFNVHDYDIY